MRTLFVRIFLSFWIAMGLILAGGIVVTTTIVWQRLQALDNLDPTVLVANAATALKAGGEAKLQQWITNTEADEPGLSIYVLDQRGHDLLARRLPVWLHERVEKSLIADGRYSGRRAGRHESEPDTESQGRIVAREQDLRAAPEIVAADGTGYTMVFATTGPSPLALLGRFEVFFALVGLALLVSGIVCWWLARHVSAPIARLQLSARSFAAGNLDARVGKEFSSRRDELGVLARDFDRMAERLRALLDSKETLLRDLSHELRSPLARLRVATELARHDGADLETQLNRIERDTERLDVLISQILQLSQLNNAEPIYTRQPVDLAALLDEIVEDARLEATASGKSIDWTSARDITVEGDLELMRRAAENIIRNAVRFTAPGTSVEIALRRRDNLAILRVRDHGPGVPATDLTQIFEPFYRVSHARDRNSGGTGLGLAITARVAALHRGTVRADNCADGGLAVELALPAVAAARQAAPSPSPTGA